MMQKKKNRLRLAYPRDGNEDFELVLTENPIYIALRDSRGCYIGFNSQGEPVEPCTLDLQSDQVRLHLRLFQRKRQ